MFVCYQHCVNNRKKGDVRFGKWGCFLRLSYGFMLYYCMLGKHNITPIFFGVAPIVVLLHITPLFSYHGKGVMKEVSLL